MCYKIIHGLICLDYSAYFTTAAYDRTRGHNYKLFIPIDLTSEHFCFASRVCHLWNNLPYDIVNACNVNLLKRSLVAFNFDL